MIITIIISLFIIIFLHEIGHLIMAIKLKCKIQRISIGYGKPIFSFEIKNIRINITPWLFGGYVKLKGELEFNNSNDSFMNISYRKKLYIALIGCCINIITGIITLFIGLVLNLYFFICFGILSLGLGICNLCPIFPCLDGGYVIWIPICEKLYGKEKGYRIFMKINKISLILIIILNILTAIIWLILILIKNG